MNRETTQLFTRKEMAIITAAMIVAGFVFYGLSLAGRVAVGVITDVWSMFN